MVAVTRGDKGQEGVVSLLVEAGADINAVNNVSILYYAYQDISPNC